MSEPYAVTGLAVIRDGAGEFIFATTTSKAYAVDAESGEVLWQQDLPGGGNRVAAVANYVLVTTGNQLVEYFPTRSSLTRGVSWADIEPGPDGTLDVGTVLGRPASAQRARIANPREVQRLRGADRYAAALAVSESTYGSANSAVIATGMDFPDALTAGPLAAALNGPVLLNSGSDVAPAVARELRRLGVSNVYIAGGTGAVPSTVEKGLRSAGFTVTRLGGQDRFGTAERIADELRSLSGKSSIPAVLATGMVFPDALSATPVAAEMGAAILLTAEDTMPGSTLSYVQSGKVSSTAAVGGPARRAAADADVRVEWTASGADRYSTSALVSDRVKPSTLAYVATGLDYPDALTAGPAAAHFGAPVLLSGPESLPSSIKTSLSTRDVVRMVGGLGVLTPGVGEQIRALP